MSPPAEQVWADAADHVETYRRTGGVEGHRWHGRPHLLLTTTGRRTGREHTVPLVYAPLSTSDGPRLVVVASAGGAETHPAWFLNLRHDPGVGVQLWGRTWTTAAEQADGEVEEAAWAAAGRTWEGFLRYRQQTARRIPFVLLDLPPGGLPDAPRLPGPDALP